MNGAVIVIVLVSLVRLIVMEKYTDDRSCGREPGNRCTYLKYILSNKVRFRYRTIIIGSYIINIRVGIMFYVSIIKAAFSYQSVRKSTI
jgi:hypothetical protein